MRWWRSAAARACSAWSCARPVATLRHEIAAIGGAPVPVVATSLEALRAGVCIALISGLRGMVVAVDHGESRKRGLSLAAPVLELAREVR